jgi:hypothetical protein
VALEGLDKINWAELHHAYGRATDVPDMLRGLQSDDAETRSKCIDRLYNFVAHQGSIYSVTSVVVPFLVKLLKSPKTIDKVAITEFLVFVAESCFEHLKMFETYDMPDLGSDAFFIDIAKTFEVIDSFSETFFEMLNHDDSSIMIQILNLLPLCKSLSGEPARMLFSLAHENKLSINGSMFLNSLCRLKDNFYQGIQIKGLSDTEFIMWLTQNCFSDSCSAFKFISAVYAIKFQDEKVVESFNPVILAEIDSFYDLPKELKIVDVFQIIQDTYSSNPTAHLNWIVSMVHHPRDEVRAAAVWNLAFHVSKQESDFEKLANLISKLLEDSDEKVQFWAMSALKVSPHLANYSLEKLISLISGHEVVDDAMEILGKLKEPRAIPVLAHHLQDPEKVMTVLHYLPLFGTVAAPLVPQLRAIFIGDQEVIFPIDASASNARLVVQTWVARVYEHIGVEAIKALPELRAALGEVIETGESGWNGKILYLCTLLKAIGAMGRLAAEVTADLTALLNLIRATPDAIGSRKDWLEQILLETLKSISN